jgi:hypothetical protein
LEKPTEDGREYNSLVARASQANALVEQMQRARRLYATGRGIEQAFGSNLINRSDPMIDIAPDDVLRMSPDAARSKALRAVETRGRTLGSNPDPMDTLIRASITEDPPNVDGSYIARRTLITESDAYRSDWNRVVTEPHPLLTAEEIGALRALKDLDRYENRAMGDFTNTAGRYGVPVFIDACSTNWTPVGGPAGSVLALRNYRVDGAWRCQERRLGRFGVMVSGGGLSSWRTSRRASHATPAM